MIPNLIIQEPQHTNEIEEPLHTDEVTDIISKPPIWIYRWGISLFLFIILTCLGVSAIISYPDIVRTQLTIRSLTPPKAVSVGSASIKLIKIDVQNGQDVKKGARLATVDNGHDRVGIFAKDDGRVNYNGIIHENQEFDANQIIFFIHAHPEGYFGEMVVPVNSSAKVKPGQTVLLKLAEYSNQGFGDLKGTIRYITDDSSKGRIIMAEVDLNKTDIDRTRSNLRNGMVASADIILVPTTLLHSMIRNLFHGINSGK